MTIEEQLLILAGELTDDLHSYTVIVLASGRQYTVLDISDEEYRDYRCGGYVCRIAAPRALITIQDDDYHYIVNAAGEVHRHQSRCYIQTTLTPLFYPTDIPYSFEHYSGDF